LRDMIPPALMIGDPLKNVLEINLNLFQR